MAEEPVTGKPAAAAGETIIQTENLSKTFRSMATGTNVRALQNLTIDVCMGEIFGLVGPNGSGKTTTLKLLLGLLSPTSGKISIFGRTARSREMKKRVGFLPDGPYFYDHLNAVELLDFYGSLFRFSKAECRKRAEAMLDLVGLMTHRDLIIRHYSKGMLQRVGLAQAMINDPDLLFLDEPTTGLDPMGARAMKEAIVRIRGQGKTVFLCSHLLADVQNLCDRVAILDRGELIRFDRVDNLIGPTRVTQVVATDLSEEVAKGLESDVVEWHASDGTHVFEGKTPEAVYTIMEGVRSHNGKLVSVEPKGETLEDVFVKAIRDREASGAKASAEE